MTSVRSDQLNAIHFHALVALARGITDALVRLHMAMTAEGAFTGLATGQPGMAKGQPGRAEGQRGKAGA